jgi:hypothetical protein
VVAFVNETRMGRTVKRITSEWTFPTYEEAQRFVAGAGSPTVRIISKDPHATCVPLEVLEDFTQVFHSVGREPATGALGLPLVQVFEYRPRGRPAPLS